MHVVAAAVLLAMLGAGGTQEADHSTFQANCGTVSGMVYWATSDTSGTSFLRGAHDVPLYLIPGRDSTDLSESTHTLSRGDGSYKLRFEQPGSYQLFARYPEKPVEFSINIDSCRDYQLHIYDTPMLQNLEVIRRGMIL